MMPSEDELIEVVAKKILDAAMYNESPERRKDLFESEKPYWTDCAKAALQALLSSLPEPENNNYTDDGCDISKLYRQLMGMKK